MHGHMQLLHEQCHQPVLRTLFVGSNNMGRMLSLASTYLIILPCSP